jgi:SAM-dependent methyltransferase
MNEYIETNRRHWDEVVPLHVASDFYDVESFRAGGSTLLRVEREEVGDVRGKTLLHLQCHFGMDTLSWPREGAIVTGVDFSAEAIKAARSLAAELAIDARFVESDVYKLPEVMDRTFDIVFASYGVLCWLPDLPTWASIAANFVKPGGIFYVVDGHPLGTSLDDEAGSVSLRLSYPYMSGEPMVIDADGTYADRRAKIQNRRTYEFSHNLGEIVSSVIDSGLGIEFLHEWPFVAWQQLPSMMKGDDGYWRLPGMDSVPFLFSVKARKPN